MIKGIFFDLGGTLFSYKNVIKTTFPILDKAVKRSGKTPNTEQIRAAYKESSSEIASEYSSKNYYLHRDFFNDVFILFLKKLDLKYDRALLKWYANYHRDQIIDCLELKTDCLDTLKKLKKNNIYTSIVSNIDEDMLNPLLEKGQILPFIDDAISSEKAQSCKPDKKIFELALERSGIKAEESFFVGDSPEHDIAGAAPFGFKTVLILDGGLEPPLQTGKNAPNATYTIASLSELTTLL